MVDDSDFRQELLIGASALLFLPDSAVRHLPEDIDQHQAKYLDGIRYAGDTAALAYSRLTRVLKRASLDPDADPPADAFVLERLLRGMKGLKRTPPIKILLKHLSHYEKLRHSIQHLDGTIVRRLDEEEAVWGSLSWAYLVSRQSGELRLFTMVPGHLRSVGAPQVNPLGRDFMASLDHVELAAFGSVATLSATYWRLREFAPKFSQLLDEQFGSHRRLRSDLFLRIDAEPVHEKGVNAERG
jgi:hypothetical protein